MNLTTSGMTVHALMKEAAETYSERPFVRYMKNKKWEEVTFKEYENNLLFAVNLIGREQIRKNRVVILSKDKELLLRWVFSVMYCGGVAVPLNTEQNDEEIIQNVKYLEPEAIVVDNNETDKWKKMLPPDMFSRIIIAEDADKNASFKEAPEKVLPEDPAIIVPPVHQWYQTAGLMHTYTIMPFHHVMAIAVDILMPLMMGGSVTIGTDKQNFLQELRTSGGNTFSCVPMILSYMLMMLKNKKADNPEMNNEAIKAQILGDNLKFICCAGSAMDPDMRDEIEPFGVNVITGYGMSEITSQVSSDIYTLFGKRKRTSIGKISPIIEWKNTEEGELLVKGPGVMDCYWNMPEETEETLKDGWLHTGDLIEVDEEGYLFFKGRCKNLIIASNGENISPEIVEKQLLDKIPEAEFRVSDGNGGLHVDIGLNGMSDDGIEMVLREYNKGRQMCWQLRSYSLYEKNLEKNLSGKILRDNAQFERREIQYI